MIYKCVENTMNSRRGIGFLIISPLILFAAGCGGAEVDSAATEVAAIAQTTTAQTAAAPTATATAEPTATLIPTTPTPTITPTATPTETPEPTPTPVGGGNGIITFTINPAWEKPPDDLNGIWRVRSDGSELTQVLSRPELEDLLGDSYDRFVIYFENHGQGYLWTEGAFHVVDEDWKVVRTIDTQDLNFVDFSPDGSQVLFVGSDGQFHFVPVEEGEPVVVSADADRFNNIHYSADGTSIYYSRGQGGGNMDDQLRWKRFTAKHIRFMEGIHSTCRQAAGWRHNKRTMVSSIEHLRSLARPQPGSLQLARFVICDRCG